MCGWALNLSFASDPARSTMRANPAVVNGAPRSEMNTNGGLRLLPRAAAAAGRVARPRGQGELQGVPFFTRRTWEGGRFEVDLVRKLPIRSRASTS